MKNKTKLISKKRRELRVRSRVRGTKARPRLTVYRSNKYIYAQIIDDVKGATLVSVNENDLADSKSKKTKGSAEKKSKETLLTKIQKAKLVGEILAKKAKSKKIVKVSFDRGSYKYHGRVKALAEGAREGGLQF